MKICTFLHGEKRYQKSRRDTVSDSVPATDSLIYTALDRWTRVLCTLAIIRRAGRDCDWHPCARRRRSTVFIFTSRSAWLSENFCRSMPVWVKCHVSRKRYVMLAHYRAIPPWLVFACGHKHESLPCIFGENT